MRRFSIHSLVSLGALLLVIAPAMAQNGDALPPPAKIEADFSRDIEPLFTKSCVACHNGKTSSGGLRLDDRDAALKGGNSGPVIKPGDSANSRLIHLVAGLKEGLVMPQAGERLSAEQIGLLRAWIDQGAAWPRATSAAATQPSSLRKSDHWSFQPVVKPNPPQVRNRAWVRNDIDAFVLARLEKEGLEPSPEADRFSLIRRLSLDLIGLPPSPAEVAEFVNDNSPDAYEHLVDRLLASPHYGEKWARHWLDLARYADTDGYETDQLRPNAWRYRHWLVEALNHDMPFDEFTIEQIAGDLLPHATVEQKVATGFHRNTLNNREGGAGLEEYRVEQVIDRASTVGTVWMGLTVGCARCHDHKYDPISQKEFYQLYAFLNTADEINIDAPLPGEIGPYLARRGEYEEKRRAMLAPIRAEVEEMQKAWEKRLFEADANPGKDHFWDRAYELLGLVWGGHIGEGQLEGIRILETPWEKRSETDRERMLDYFIKQGELIDKERFEALKLKDIAKQIDELGKQYPGLTRAQTVDESPFPRATHILLRGNFRNPGIEVKPDVPRVLPPLPSDDSVPPRLRLARWLVSREHPLTSRVAVNRAWQELFGRGIVFTSEDFGTQGTRPSHPELLDWLATEFMDRGWSQKALHKLILMSATYRQSSETRPELQSTDPNNALLARQSRLRLPAELIRDSGLTVSGLLNDKIGGPTVKPPQPDSVSQDSISQEYSDNKWEPSPGAERYRRGLYTFIRRTTPFAQSVTFDLPDPGRTCTRRERSNSPLQALNLLNDPVFFEMAQALAVRIITEEGGNDRNRIDHAFRLVLCRPPDPSEKDRLESYFHKQVEILRKNPEESKAMLAVQLGGLDPAERGAWVALSSVLLNLDEFITRE